MEPRANVPATAEHGLRAGRRLAAGVVPQAVTAGWHWKLPFRRPHDKAARVKTGGSASPSARRADAGVKAFAPGAEGDMATIPLL
jgi:hypothetical protein